MTRLNDYLRAERPDETEPASFYVPGAADWREGRTKRVRKIFPDGGPDEDEIIADPLDTTDTNDIDELAAAQSAAALDGMIES